jgi:hypothetical protein
MGAAEIRSAVYSLVRGANENFSYYRDRAAVMSALDVKLVELSSRLQRLDLAELDLDDSQFARLNAERESLLGSDPAIVYAMPIP